MDNVDNLQETETDTATAQDSAQEVETDTSPAPDTSDEKQTQQDPYVPFKGGKEKFKVNGQEYEWDWDTTKRYAQLGRSGQLALEKAATTEKKARQFYDQLVEHAAKNPDGLIEILTGRKRTSVVQGRDESEVPSESGDPRDAKIRELEERLSKREQRDEQLEIDKERQAIQNELDAAAKKFPELDDEITREYVKVQYRRHLQSLNPGDEPLDLEDIAFHVAQKIRDSRAKKSQETKKRFEENRRRAPVSSSGIPAGGETGKKPMTIEDVKRLAGRL